MKLTLLLLLLLLSFIIINIIAALISVQRQASRVSVDSTQHWSGAEIRTKA